MHDSWQVYHSQHAQPPILRCGPAWLSHWRFRVQIITLISKDQRCVPLGWSGSGSVIQDLSHHGASKELVNPRPECIRRFLWCTMIQRDLGSLILFQIIPKERSQNHFAFGLQYKWYGNYTSDMYSPTCRASKSSIHSLRQSRLMHKTSKVALSTLCTASHNHTMDICRIVCTWSTRSPPTSMQKHMKPLSYYF